MDNLNGTLQELLETLDMNEVSYVFARSEEKTDKDAYEAIGYTKGWWFGKNKEHRDYMNAIALKVKIDTAFKARQKLIEAAPKAADKLIEQIDDRRPTVSQRAAIDILDRTVGKAPQKVEQENSGETVIRVVRGEKPND